MSRFKAPLLGLVIALALPAVVRANALNFGFSKGIVAFTSTPGIGVLSNNPALPKTPTKGKLSTLNFIGAIPNGKSFKGSNLGTVLFTTGVALPGATKSLIQYAPGGSIIIKTSKTIGKGKNKILPGAVLFTGFFNDVESFSITRVSKKIFTGVLTGEVGTTFANPKLLALLGLNSVASGNFQSIEIDISPWLHGGAVATGFLTVSPEPGTLALFGTGLLSLAGMIRRKKTF